MRPATLLVGLATALWVLTGSSASGQRIRVPTMLSGSAPVRVAERSSPDPAPTDSAPSPATAVPAGPQDENLMPQGLVPEPLYLDVPPAVAADPCFPCETVVPCAPEPACSDYQWQVFGDFLWLRARDAEVAYAVPTNGAIVPPAGVAPLQIGPVATVESGWASGFRVGASRALKFPAYNCPVGGPRTRDHFPARLEVSYTRYESSDVDSLSVDPPNVNDPLVLHPGTEAALPNFLDADAGRGIDFQLIDADYRAPLFCGRYYSLDYRLGARYARLDQDFRVTFLNGGTIENVATGIGFDGAGIRVGFEGERLSPTTGLLVYSRAAASFLAGRFRASYSQVENIRGTLVDTGLEADRIVPILDLELGLGWTGPQERFRLTAGYMISAWCNAVTTDEFILAVQQNNFVEVSDTLTFDGLVARADLRF